MGPLADAVSSIASRDASLSDEESSMPTSVLFHRSRSRLLEGLFPFGTVARSSRRDWRAILSLRSESEETRSISGMSPSFFFSCCSSSPSSSSDDSILLFALLPAPRLSLLLALLASGLEADARFVPRRSRRDRRSSCPTELETT